MFTEPLPVEGSSLTRKTEKKPTQEQAIENHSKILERPKESQARELASVVKEDPEAAAEVWGETVEETVACEGLTEPAESDEALISREGT